MVISHSYVSLPEGRQLEKSEVWMLITCHPMRADILIKHTARLLRHVLSPVASQAVNITHIYI